MQKLVKDYLNELNKKQKKRRRAGIAVVLLVVLVVGGVVGSLTQYGVAMTGRERCGQEEHQHSEECYKEELVCGLEEGEGHTHADECLYPEELVCGLEETEGQDGEEGHVHTEDCYAVPEGWACGLEESEGHTHTEDCYESELACGKEEHVHTEDCYVDKDADVEDAGVWDAQYADVKWKESWGENLVTAAQMQIGYEESSDNYITADDGSHKGYTRYGQFAVNNGAEESKLYADWDAAFVNFCLYYAGLNGIETKVFPEIPGETDTAKWCEEFEKVREENSSYLTGPQGYTPEAGDIVFFDRETEEQMGIVSSYNKETNEIKIIEGNRGNKVKENTYGADDSHIVRYLKLTEMENDYKAADADKAEEYKPENEQKVQEETEEQEKEDKANEENVNSGMSLEELENLPEDEVGSAIWQTAAVMSARSNIRRAAAARTTWSFDTYYVNQDDKYDVTKTSDFNLKYQMEFHTSKDFAENEISIRINRTLFSDRDGKKVNPDQIAVPQVNKDAEVT